MKEVRHCKERAKQIMLLIKPKYFTEAAVDVSKIIDYCNSFDIDEDMQFKLEDIVVLATAPHKVTNFAIDNYINVRGFNATDYRFASDTSSFELYTVV